MHSVGGWRGAECGVLRPSIQSAGLRRSVRAQQHARGYIARGQRRRQTFASPSTVRWSSAVDSTIELACTAHRRPSPTRPEQPSLASVGGATWPLMPHSRTRERPTLGSVRSFCADDGNAYGGLHDKGYTPRRNLKNMHFFMHRGPDYQAHRPASRRSRRIRCRSLALGRA